MKAQFPSFPFFLGKHFGIYKKEREREREGMTKNHYFILLVRKETKKKEL